MMQTLDGDLTLIWQSSAEFAQTPADARSGIAVDEQLRQGSARAQPLRILLDDRDDVRRLALDRQFARPCQRRDPSFTIAIGRAVSLHLFIAELAKHAGGQDDVHEEILVQNQSLSLRRAQSAKPRAPLTGVVLPSARQHDCFKIGYRLDLVGVATGAIEADRPSPVVPDKCDVLRELQCLEPRIDIACVIDETVSLTRRLSGPTHAGARQRRCGLTWGMTFRHWYDQVGFPWRNMTGSPLPISM